MLDTDHDGIPDIWETSVFHTDPLKQDTDGDGYSDQEEILQGFDPLSAARLTDKDFDQDGLSDRLELVFGTDPTSPDSDGDGYSDGEEITKAYSPTSTDPVLLKKTLVVHLTTNRLEQRLANVPIASFLISPGTKSHPTPPGTYKTLNKNPRQWSSAAKLWMPWWMEFSAKGYGIHELPEWPNGKKEGADHLGKPASHGCIRLGIGAAKQIYDWTPVGTAVEIVKK